MDIFSAVLSGAYEVLSIDMTLFGFTFSYWDVFIWSLLVVIIGSLIVRFLWK